MAQEVFARAIESIGDYDEAKGTVPGWMRGIVLRVISGQKRALIPIAARPLSYHGEGAAPAHGLDPIDETPGVDDRLMREERAQLIGLALTELPPHWERALRWKYCEGLSVAEIARRRGASEKSVESMLSRARAAFREVYEKTLEAEFEREAKEDSRNDGR